MKKITSLISTVILVGTALVAAPQAAQATSFVGKYYVGTEDGTGTESIHEFDPVSGVTSPTPIATFPAANYLTSLEVDGTNGIAYAVTYSFGAARTQFWTVDLSTGIATLTNADMSSTPGADDRNFSDLALDPISGVLYGRSESSTDVFTINKLTGVSTSVGTITGSGFPANGFGLAINGSQQLVATSGSSGTSPNRTTTFGVLNTSTAAVMPFGKTVVNGASNGVPIWAADFTQAGDLVVVGQSGRGTISATSLATLDLVGSGFVSTTASTSVSATTASGYLAPAFAIANTAPAASRTVTYDANSGSGSETATSGSGALTLASGSGLSRAGYTLSAWNTVANGSGTSLALGSSYTPSANITLYAQWAAAPVVASHSYTGPLFDPFSKRFVDSVKGAKVTLTGRRLDGVKAITVAGKQVKINLASYHSLEIELPAGVDGSADLTIVTASGSMSWHNAFTYQNPKFAKVTDFVAPKETKKKAKPKR
jgi:Listeria-Bacteroides repeat domain (List_Bact_rpt)